LSGVTVTVIPGGRTGNLREILPVGRIHFRDITAVIVSLSLPTILSRLRAVRFFHPAVTIMVMLLQGSHNRSLTAALIDGTLHGTSASVPSSAPVAAAVIAVTTVIATATAISAAKVTSAASKTG